jgi:hypothetical protein
MCARASIEQLQFIKVTQTAENIFFRAGFAARESTNDTCHPSIHIALELRNVMRVSLMPGAFQYKMNELENEMIAAAGAYSWKDHALCGYTFKAVKCTRKIPASEIFLLHNFIQIDLLCEWRKNLHRILCLTIAFFFTSLRSAAIVPRQTISFHEIHSI